MWGSKKRLIILITILVLEIIFSIFYLWEINTIVFFLNHHSNLLLVFANITLVIITAIYAYYTNKMTKIMQSQVQSEIIISYLEIKSSLNYKNEQGMSKLDQIKDGVSTEDIRRANLDFYINFQLSNKSSCGGSIIKPKLIIKIKDFEYYITPKTKRLDKVYSGGKKMGYKEVDDGGSIFLKGGELLEIKLPYLLNSVDLNKTKKMVHYIIKNKITQKDISYYVEYNNNLGEKYTKKILKIS